MILIVIKKNINILKNGQDNDDTKRSQTSC